MNEIEYIKLKITLQNGNSYKLFFRGIEELNAYINDKYRLNNKKSVLK